MSVYVTVCVELYHNWSKCHIPSSFLKKIVLNFQHLTYHALFRMYGEAAGKETCVHDRLLRYHPTPVGML